MHTHTYTYTASHCSTVDKNFRIWNYTYFMFNVLCNYMLYGLLCDLLSSVIDDKYCKNGACNLTGNRRFRLTVGSLVVRGFVLYLYVK